MKATGISRMTAAMAMAVGALFGDRFGFSVPRARRHRVTANSRLGRSMTSRKYGSGNFYAGVSNGARECDRRRRQLANGQLAQHPTVPMHGVSEQLRRAA